VLITSNEISVEVNGQKYTLPEGSTLGDVLKISRAPYIADTAIVILEGIAEKRMEVITEYAINTPKGEFRIELKNHESPSGKLWIEHLKEYEGKPVCVVNVPKSKVPVYFRYKNKQTFSNGKNVFDFLGFVISKDGKTLTYYEHDGTDWNVYQDLSAKKLSNMDEKHWGKGFKLSEWVPVYDWAAQDGYVNFATWVENAK